ncbi:hypothetical protein HPP92_027088 [Vanilla planifolia]|uniref:Uncharacterized protein n=1 Tax=Vanilla planifolia TaxID=51239 RepID=A0A835PA55_VANPL|nr:hypothetical protein HPP92_027088 [Vanilla planifolia]
MKHGPPARQSDTWNVYNPKGHRRSRPGPVRSRLALLATSCATRQRRIEQQRNGSLFIAVMGGAKRGDGCCLVLELSSKRVLDADGGKKGSRFRLEKGMCVADVDRCEAWRKSRDGLQSREVELSSWMCCMSLSSVVQ